MKLEYAAGNAAECQGRRPIAELRDGAEKFDVIIAEVGKVLAASAALLVDGQ